MHQLLVAVPVLLLKMDAQILLDTTGDIKEANGFKQDAQRRRIGTHRAVLDRNVVKFIQQLIAHRRECRIVAALVFYCRQHHLATDVLNYGQQLQNWRIQAVVVRRKPRPQSTVHIQWIFYRFPYPFMMRSALRFSKIFCNKRSGNLFMVTECKGAFFRIRRSNHALWKPPALNPFGFRNFHEKSNRINDMARI